AYLSFEENRSVRNYGAAFALYVLAMLSKTTAVTLPATLLVLLWWRQGRLQWHRHLRPLLPWLLVGGALGLFVSWVERKYLGAEGGAFALTFGQRILVAGRALWFYAAKDLWPSPLVFFYPKWRPDPGAPGQWLFPLGLAVLAIVLWSLRRRTRLPLAVLLCFAGVLFPVLGFFNFYGSLYSFVADHWQYLALPVIIGTAASGVAFAPKWFSRGKGRMVAVLGVVLPAPLGLLTWQQCAIYRNDDTLYRSTLAANPGCWMAYNNLGEELMEAGRFAEAAGEFQRSVQLEGGYFESHYNLGNALAHLGRWPEAAAAYKDALSIRPGNSTIHDNLAIVLSRMGREEDALAEYETAVSLDSGNKQAHNNLGNQLLRMGRLAEAVDQYEQALRIDPGYPDAHNNLADAEVKRGRLSEALDEYQKAVTLKPDFAEAQNNLGNTLVRMGRPDEAIGHYQAALRLNPRDAQIHLNFGIALAGLPGRLPEAIEEVETAVRLKPDDPKAREVLSRLQAAQ
ncbi:MAG TPA: tetratricopeptide repeat protein, partial [Opitutaceae bacterium]|nr:tetratricopeptide repeat protein [Opitutaceae bacterium]